MVYYILKYSEYKCDFVVAGDFGDKNSFGDFVAGDLRQEQSFTVARFVIYWRDNGIKPGTRDAVLDASIEAQALMIFHRWNSNLTVFYVNFDKVLSRWWVLWWTTAKEMSIFYRTQEFGSLPISAQKYKLHKNII